MKKKIILALALVTLFVCLFAVAVSAEDMTRYIEFDVTLDGAESSTRVYVAPYDSDMWTVKVDMNGAFYTALDQTGPIDKTKIVKIDMSNAKAYGYNNNNVKQVLAASDNSVFANVTEIKLPNNPGNYTFVNGNLCKGWTSLRVVDFGSANHIGDSAFENCTFTEFTIPEQIEAINNNAFKGNTSLTKVSVLGPVGIMVGEKPKNVGSGIFMNCTALTDVNIGQMRKVGAGMFQGCSSLTQITIPETATEIGATAFYKTSLVSLHVPAAVTSIGYQVLEDVTTFTTLTFAEGSQLKTISHRAFQRSNLSGELVLPEGLEEIAYSAFSGTKITSIKLPSTLTTVGHSAFASTSITTAVIPDSLTSIPSYMFNGCKSLTTVSIPAGFTKIGEKAFQSCSAITSLTFRGNAGENAVIDTAAFESCYKLGVVTIPEGVTTLNNCAFNASGITHLTLPTTLTTVTGNSTFNVWGQGNITSDYKLQSVKGLENTQISTVVYAMFRGQSKWAPEMITLPNTVTKIDTYAFADVAMKNISLGASLETINAEAFTACMSLKNVYVPGTITSHANNSFYTRGFFFFVTSSDMDYVEAFAAKVGVTKFVSIEDYKKNPDNYKSDKWVIYGCNQCEVFYDNIHDEQAPYDAYKGDKYVTDYCTFAGCSRCPKVVETKIHGPLFISKGYSKTTDAFMFDMKVDFEAIEIFESLGGTVPSYGLVVSGNAGLTKLLNADGTVIDNSVLKVNFDESGYTNVQVRLNNITTPQSQAMKVHVCAYIIDADSVKYVGNGKVTTDDSALIAYEDIKGEEDDTTQGGETPEVDPAA